MTLFLISIFEKDYDRRTEQYFHQLPLGGNSRHEYTQRGEQTHSMEWCGPFSTMLETLNKMLDSKKLILKQSSVDPVFQYFMT